MRQGGASADRASDAIWQEYRRTSSRELRNQLVLQHAPLVKFVALRVGSRLPGHIEIADLVSAGLIGLIDAIDRFDPARGVKFETYATLRIRGAILDDLRATDWVPRSVRAKLTALEARAATLTQELGRVPEVSELARSVGLDERQVELVRSAIPSAAVLSLDQSVGPSRDERATLADGLADASGAPGMDASEEINDLVKRASERIDRRSQAILRMSYEDGKTLAEIGRSLGVTESRVCQIRTKALRAVREQVRQLCLEDAALGLPVSA